jgi:hypothetical protein
MKIRHLEIESCYTWFSKLWIYGRNYLNYGPISGYKPLTFRQRLRVQYAMLSQAGFTLPRAVWCFCSDVIGSTAYLLGRLSAKLYKANQ